MEKIEQSSSTSECESGVALKSDMFDSVDKKEDLSLRISNIDPNDEVNMSQGEDKSIKLIQDGPFKPLSTPRDSS